MSIQESNKMIAEFMGLTWHEDEVFGPLVSKDGTSYNPKYDTDWSWLMPVGKKIHDYLQGLERPSVNHCCKGDMIETDILCHLHTYSLEKVYEHIVLFIQWYNDFTSQPSNTTP